MRSIPNMTILETGDATEVESICEAADSHRRPGLVPGAARIGSASFQDTPIKVGEMRELVTRRRHPCRHSWHLYRRSDARPRSTGPCRV